MKMKILFLSTIVCLAFLPIQILSQVLMPTGKASPDKQLLNGIWKFKFFPSDKTGKDSVFYTTGFNVSDWASIKTPGNWELQGYGEPVYHKKTRLATGLYRTTFNIPPNWNGNPIFIAFDGVAFGYTFYVNGQPAGEFASSFNRQSFDISSFVKPGTSNILAVKVFTQPKGYEFDTNDDWSLSGIIRDVTVFKVPPTHIKDVVIKTFIHNKDTSLQLKAIIENTSSTVTVDDWQVYGRIKDPAGKIVREFNTKAAASNEKSIAYSAIIKLDKALLWSAEKPQLYTLNLTLKSKGKIIQTFTDKVGVRQVTWTGGVFKINGMPVKLKGVNHHDLSPVNGRSMTEPEMIEDLKLMQRANINLIRTCHYPPHPRLLELCDSMGMYVMDEVPYGFGEEHLKDTSYLPLLLERARLTHWRDKNRPCVIFWTVGNENPITDIGLQTGRYMKKLDETRPYCFPQTPTVCEEMLKALPDSVDLLDYHYPLAEDLRRIAPVIDRPLIAGEYAHALGLDFNAMDSLYEAMWAHPRLMGGAVWMFSDQGIHRKSPTPVQKGESTVYVWTARDSIYDTGGNQGTDGIVYANRVPQVDYWQTRKVYSPVKAAEADYHVLPGNNTIKVKLINRHDFTNLSEIKGEWQLYADTMRLNKGVFTMNCLPHDTTVVSISLNIPQKQKVSYYYVKLAFKNQHNYQFYEKVYPLTINGTQSLLAGMVTQTEATVQKDKVITAPNYRFEWAPEKSSFLLQNTQGQVLISKGMLARVGRKSTVAQDATLTSKRSQKKHRLWKPYLLSNSVAEIKRQDRKELSIHCEFVPDSLKNRSISGDLIYSFSDSGFIQVHYLLHPKGEEEAVETGISFVIPHALSEFRWVGRGPYEAYPGKDKLSEFGIYHLSANDLYFPGNRQLVDCAVFTDKEGTGFVLLSNKANISVERSADGIVVSHNAFVASRFNKYVWPDVMYSMPNTKIIEGQFTIIPITAGKWPAGLSRLFGDAKAPAKLFQPFYESYDQ